MVPRVDHFVAERLLSLGDDLPGGGDPVVQPVTRGALLVDAGHQADQAAAQDLVVAPLGIAQDQGLALVAGRHLHHLGVVLAVLENGTQVHDLQAIRAGHARHLEQVEPEVQPFLVELHRDDGAILGRRVDHG